MVEHHLAKVGVEGSNPFVRSIAPPKVGLMGEVNRPPQPTFFDRCASSAHQMATWPSGKAEACKAFIPGSNPGVASRVETGRPSGRPVLHSVLPPQATSKALHGWLRCPVPAHRSSHGNRNPDLDLVLDLDLLGLLKAE